MVEGQQEASSRPLPQPSRTMPPPVPPAPRALAATHDHDACSGCVRQAEAIDLLQRDICRARGRIADLERDIQRITAAPEMGRRKWTFEE